MSLELAMYAEVRDNGGWRLALDVAKSSESMDYQRAKTPIPLISRYTFARCLGSILSGCRDRYIVDAIDPPVAPRRLPNDMSPELGNVAEADGWTYAAPECAGWLTLAELDQIDWSREVTLRAWVDRHDAKRFGDGRQPFPSGNVRSYSPAYSSKPDRGLRTVTWVATLGDLAGRPFMEAIAQLAGLGHADQVRIVWWYI